jgi:hypothetical protein
MPVILRCHRVVAAAILIALPIRVTAQLVAPASGAPPGPRTGMIVGQVIDAATGAAVPEALVRFSMPKYSQGPETPRALVMADADGRFFFADLPAGEYYMQATKDGYAPGTYGQRLAWGQSHLLSLAEGERLADLTLRVWKYGVIGGIVVDEAGEPVVGVAVRALIKSIVGGAPRYGSAEVISELVPATVTDDRGMFRLTQLIPGTYVVAVPSTQTTLPATYLHGPDPALRSELFFSGIDEIAFLGQPRTQQVGDAALMTLSRVTIPPPPTPTGRMAVYRTTYYPAAATAAAATPIAITAGEERSDIAIGIRPEPAVRISGRLVTPEGTAPPPMTIRLIGSAMSDVITSLGSGAGNVGFETVSGMSDETGRFTLLGVPPGQYVLTQANGFLSRALQQGETAYWLSQPVAVGAGDLTDLTVTVHSAFRVEGRIEFRSGATLQPVPPAAMARVMANVGIILETPHGQPGRVAVQAKIGATTSFATVAAGGRYLIRPYERPGWVVESITAGGKDITDRVLDLQADMTSLVVTFTDRPSPVTGTVRDARGDPSTTAVVLAFPVEPQRWTGYGASPRNLKSALATRTGVYTFDHLPPGGYYMVAIDPADVDGWQDPKRLEALASVGTRVTVSAGENSKTVDLTVKTAR